MMCAALAGVALAGCSASPIVTETPSPTQTTEAPVVSATPSPTPTELTTEELLALLPEGAELQDLEGAVITAQAFLEEFPKLYSEEGSALWEPLSLESCMFCADALRGANELKEDGTVRTGGYPSFDESATGAFVADDGESVLVRFRMTEAPATEIEVDGTETEFPQNVFDVYMELSSVDGLWRIVGVDPESVTA